MSRYADTSRTLRLDPDSFAGGYFRNAVYRHWDPYEDVPDALLQQDRERLAASDMTEDEFQGLRAALAKFGAGEEAVTEDLAPLMMVLEDIDDQLFVSSQIYEEAKHTVFFDRYWREVIDPAAEALGYEVTRPTDERYFNDDYVELFDRTEAAMALLLEEDTPENRARAFCHYHLAVESVLAQTGYYGLSGLFGERGGPEYEETPGVILEGLVEGITRIRSDEGRHVGFGMNQVRDLIQRGAVASEVVQDTLQELLPLVAGAVQSEFGQEGRGADPAVLIGYASEKLAMRIEIITDAEADIPPVEELVRIDD
jgi:ribonucleoside-diphosphate reductase beta chain